MKVKICGITDLNDALEAIDAGADSLGFNFYPPSPRYIDPLACARLVAGIQERGMPATFVGVFVNHDVRTITTILDDCGLDIAQLSGDEPPEMLVALGERAFKAIRPAGQADLVDFQNRYPRRETPPACLIDGHRSGQYGGTGENANWHLARGLAESSPVILAGGLNPGNVVAAIRQVQPWGVDVASGVESTPGVKDRQKMAAFVEAVHKYTEEYLYDY
jgi:phosphoribosylanthranilate isomerase